MAYIFPCSWNRGASWRKSLSLVMFADFNCSLKRSSAFSMQRSWLYFSVLKLPMMMKEREGDARTEYPALKSRQRKLRRCRNLLALMKLPYFLYSQHWSISCLNIPRKSINQRKAERLKTSIQIHIQVYKSFISFVRCGINAFRLTLPF